MVKPEWGTKRTCPKCSTRFYDLGNDEPVHCIECGTEWIPEPVLKSKQPLPFEAVESKQKEAATDQDLEAEDLAVDEEEEPSADEEVVLPISVQVSGTRHGKPEIAGPGHGEEGGSARARVDCRRPEREAIAGGRAHHDVGHSVGVRVPSSATVSPPR